MTDNRNGATDSGENRTSVQTNEQKIVSGYYAITDPSDNIFKFYKIDLPTKGRWAGYTFLSVQASDTLYPIKNRQHREMILGVIKRNVLKAMQDYGKNVGKCAICGRTLTDDASRKSGIGPICISKVNNELYDDFDNI